MGNFLQNYVTNTSAFLYEALFVS